MIIYLDSVRKYRNASEWRPVNRATCGEFSSTGDGDNLKIIAIQMLEAGVTGEVDVYRDKTPVFLRVPLEKFATGSVHRGEQPEHLKKRGA